MKEVYLVFEGWDCHDCSPTLHSAFSTLSGAVQRAKHLEEQKNTSFYTNYSEGTITWSDGHLNTSNIVYRRESKIQFKPNDEIFPDEVIYIRRMPIDITI
jgi:hypothetical protein